MTHATPDPGTRLDAGLAALGLDLAAGPRGQLLAYLDLLTRWNRAYNLTAVRDPLAMVNQHLLDSLAIAPTLIGARAADLGTGAGLPGIVLAIAEPTRHWLLADSNGKKVRFVRTAVRELGLANVSVEQARIESLDGQFDCITTRALASLADMLAAGGHLLAPNGAWLAMKGRFPDAELAAIPDGFTVRQVVPLTVPGVTGARHLVVLGHADTATT